MVWRQKISNTKNKRQGKLWLHFGGHPNARHDLIYLSLSMGCYLVHCLLELIAGQNQTKSAEECALRFNQPATKNVPKRN
jgi:hypothetical protein